MVLMVHFLPQSGLLGQDGQGDLVYVTHIGGKGSRILQIAARVACQCACSFASSLVAVGMIGRVGRKQLSQAVLGTSCYNVTGLAVLLGMSQAIETPGGQVNALRLLWQSSALRSS
jgi:hypothetical protein